jgi:signal transduction histidine kinase
MAALIETPDPPRDEQAWALLARELPAGLCLLRVHADGGLSTETGNDGLAALLRAPVGAPRVDAARFVDPADRNRLVTQLREQGEVADCPVRLRRDDGGTVWVEISGAATALADGSLRAALLVRDVSDRRRREEQSRDVYNQLVQAEKMAALGQTMSGVAHELNNPLGAILAIAERLRQLARGTPLAASLQTLHAEAERAARIARQLLTFARKRTTTRLMVGVNTIVSDTLELRAEDFRRSRIDVRTALASTLPEVFADPHQLQQVLMNLFINAEQAMTAHAGHGVLAVATYAPSIDQVVIEVADSGPGMDDSVRQRIFDPFFTTKDVGEGTGLGLAVVNAIVEEHGGTIQVESAPGAGARFLVTLPAAGLPMQAPSSAPARATGDFDPNFGRGLRVLLADDEPALAGAVAETLREAGFDVTVARDGQEALLLAEAQTFDAVICDLRMPRVDGPTFYRAIEAVSPPQARRVIFVTGDVTGSEAARFLDETGCRWLAKPFRLAELLRAVRDIVG